MTGMLTATTDQPLFELTCPYCGQQDRLDGHWAGCIVTCRHCGRDILASGPESPVDAILRPQPSGRLRKASIALFTTVLGSVIGGIVLAAPVMYFSLSIIGIGARHVGEAAILGVIVGALSGMLLGYFLTRE